MKSRIKFLIEDAQKISSNLFKNFDELDGETYGYCVQWHYLPDDVIISIVPLGSGIANEACYSVLKDVVTDSNMSDELTSKLVKLLKNKLGE